MTEVELKEEIENTRSVLNVAVRERWVTGKVLDISRNLDCLIEKYMEICNQKMAAGQ
ncbi:MAG: aspartyl-phosphate phosphatase Spo0E family protein [Blautia sp.]|nr:aspartyl-phosphate phosphatase Spo0E family protein [Blautia sp.]